MILSKKTYDKTKDITLCKTSIPASVANNDKTKLTYLFGLFVTRSSTRSYYRWIDDRNLLLEDHSTKEHGFSW